MTSKRNDDEKKGPPQAPAGGPRLSTIFDDDYEEESQSRRLQVMPAFSSTIEPVGFEQPCPELVSPSVVSKPAIPSPRADLEQPSIPPKGWNLTEAPTLPEFFPLERTAVFVPDVPKDKADVVATRVSNMLRELSIDATYDNVKAKAKCMTAENVDFRVRLFRGRNQYNHGIIVEVQRRFGFSVDFHNQTTAILDAAKGKIPRIPPSVTGLPEMSDSEDEYDASVSSCSLEFVSKMLNHPAYDARSLGLKTLSALTDPIKMGHTTARKVSMALFEPGSDVGAKVVEIVQDDTVDPDETFGLRLMAMTTLCNGIQAVSGDISAYVWDKLRPTFIKILRSASDNPQMAYLATRSIEFHAQQDPDPSELRAVLISAQAVGKSCHADLGREAGACLQRLSRDRHA